MKALVCNGPRDVRVKNVPDAKIERPTDALVKNTSTNNPDAMSEITSSDRCLGGYSERADKCSCCGLVCGWETFRCVRKSFNRQHSEPHRPSGCRCLGASAWVPNRLAAAGVLCGAPAALRADDFHLHHLVAERKLPRPGRRTRWHSSGLNEMSMNLIKQ